MVSDEPKYGNFHHLQRISSLGQVAAGIAHEVKNPLTSVKGFLQLLKEKYSEDYLQIAESELDSALSIISNFLNVTKPEMDSEGFQEVNVAAELESTLNLFLDRMYQVSVITDLKATSVTVYARRNQLKRAFFNLLKNAFESIPNSGIIKIGQYLEDQVLIVTIEDTGIGIDEDKMHLLGTPFLTTKEDGTGMGLPQVYSAVYQIGGKITVESTKGFGTKFYLHLPIDQTRERFHLNVLNVTSEPNQSVQDFINQNQEQLVEALLAAELKYTVEEIKGISGIDLVSNALTIIQLALLDRPHELVTFAKKEGKAWAKSCFDLGFKLEWVQNLRKTLWNFLFNYFRLHEEVQSFEGFFQLERVVNWNLDTFLNHFNMSYSHFKDELLRSQREMVEDLSVPIIPLSRTVSILPLIGAIDTFRANTVEEKLLHQIEAMQIETIIIDLSGISCLDTAVLNHLFRIFDGIDLMGCKTVLTGIRADVASSLLKMNISIGSNVIKRGNLQQALEFIGFKLESQV